MAVAVRGAMVIGMTLSEMAVTAGMELWPRALPVPLSVVAPEVSLQTLQV